MKAYCIFDDFGKEPEKLLVSNGILLTVHPVGIPRPSSSEMRRILKEYDCVIIGTSQKISEDMFDGIDDPKIIATASVGKDHIIIPDCKQNKVTVLNTPKANVQSVAEFTFGCALSCCKRLSEGKYLYEKGVNNKHLSQKPEDLNGKTIGVIGAGNISKQIIEYAIFFGMTVLCWTAHPEKHKELYNLGVIFTSLERLVKEADIISVNLPNNEDTKGLISSLLIKSMKKTTTFISVSRIPTVDWIALLEKAEANPNFYVCLDVDVDNEVIAKMGCHHNVIITPHIAGGTVETRKRMFMEIANQIITFV